MEVVVKVSAIPGWVVGAALIAASYLPVALIGTHQLECSRPPEGRGLCVISRTGFLAPTESSTFRVSKLRGASMVTRTNKKGKKTHTVMLRTVDGRVPVTGSFSPAGRQSFIDEVNRFVKNPAQATLRARINDQSIEWIMGALFIISGILMVLLSRYGAIRLSLVDDKVEFRVRSLIGQENNAEFPLHEYARAAIETVRTAKGGKGHRVVLLKENDEPLPLTMSSSRFGYRQMEEVVEAIQRLIKGAQERRAWFSGSSAR